MPLRQRTATHGTTIVRRVATNAVESSSPLPCFPRSVLDRMPASRMADAPSTTLETLGEARPLTVLHIVAPAAVGGLERVVRTLAAGQLESGLDVRVVAI